MPLPLFHRSYFIPGLPIKKNCDVEVLVIEIFEF